MIGLLLTVALLLAVMWAIASYMPSPFRNVLLVIMGVIVILYLMSALGIADIPIPRLRQ